MSGTSAAAQRGGRYRHLRRLGGGATATAWLARERSTGRKVCLKQLHPHLARDRTALARLEAEIAAAARVKHPAVLPVVDVQLGGPQPAVAFPYVEGETLAARLQREGRLRPEQAVAIAQQLADALASAHAAGVVHRDIKPSNILLAEDGRTRLLDFGISRGLDAAGEVSANEGMAVGTLPYMAPEQLAAEPPTAANDVYGLAAVLYEMLAGHPPHDARTPLALAEAQRAAPPAISGVDSSLMRLIQSSLQHAPAQRPDSAALAAALEAWREGRLGSDQPTIALTPLARPAPGRRWKPVLAGLAGLLALAVMWAFAFAPDWSLEPGNQAALEGTHSASPAAPAGTPALEQPPELAPVANSRPAKPGTQRPEGKADNNKPKGKGDGNGKGEGKAEGKGDKDKGKGDGNGNGKGEGKGKGKDKDKAEGKGDKGEGKGRGDR